MKTQSRNLRFFTQEDKRMNANIWVVKKIKFVKLLIQLNKQLKYWKTEKNQREFILVFNFEKQVVLKLF